MNKKDWNKWNQTKRKIDDVAVNQLNSSVNFHRVKLLRTFLILIKYIEFPLENTLRNLE